MMMTRSDGFLIVSVLAVSMAGCESGSDGSPLDPGVRNRFAPLTQAPPGTACPGGGVIGQQVTVTGWRDPLYGFAIVSAALPGGVSELNLLNLGVENQTGLNFDIADTGNDSWQTCYFCIYVQYRNGLSLMAATGRVNDLNLSDDRISLRLTNLILREVRRGADGRWTPAEPGCTMNINAMALSTSLEPR
jgi:hypothetical protein